MLSEELTRYRQLLKLAGMFTCYHVLRVAGLAVDEEGVIDGRVSQLAARDVLKRMALPIGLEGLDNLKDLKRYAVVSNHMSYLDWAVLLGYFPAPLRFVAKRELTRVPVVGSFLRKRGVLIDRSKGEDAKAAIRRAASDGQPWPIMIFPEGTRSHDGKIRPFKRGGLRVLAEAQLSMVPVCICGTYRAFPRHGRFIKPNVPLKMTVLPPVHPNDYPNPDQAIAEVEARIRLAYEGD